MKMNSELWKSFDVGRAPVLRMRTLAWHVNTVMNCDELNAGELLLNKMAQDNILKQRDGKWVFTRLTLARKRDAKRLPQVLAACIQLLHRDKEGLGTISTLPDAWRNRNKMYEVKCALESIVVV